MKLDVEQFLQAFFTEAPTVLPQLTLPQLRQCIDAELFGARRKSVLTRLHRMYSSKRRDAERKVINAAAAITDVRKHDGTLYAADQLWVQQWRH